MVYRVYVEKKKELAAEARGLLSDLRFTISGPHLWSDYDGSGKEAAL